MTRGKKHANVIQEPSPTKTSLGQDPLTVKGGPITRLRAKHVKVAMRLLAQAPVDETLTKISISTSFVFELKEEAIWIYLLQATKKGMNSKACGRIAYQTMRSHG